MMPGKNRAADQKLEPRGLCLSDAAAYFGISPSLFSKLVEDGRAPLPKSINKRMVWDRRRLDEAFELLPEREELNPWDATSRNTGWDK